MYVCIHVNIQYIHGNKNACNKNHIFLNILEVYKYVLNKQIYTYFSELHKVHYVAALKPSQMWKIPKHIFINWLKWLKNVHPSTPAWGSATVFAEGVSYRCARRRSGEVEKKNTLFLGFRCFFHWFWFWTTKVMRENWIMSLQSSVNTTMIWNHNHLALAYMYI